ncbi:MAG: hypothetical protein AAF989_05330 [Planctomycetota bacterium]
MGSEDCKSEDKSIDHVANHLNIQQGNDQLVQGESGAQPVVADVADPPSVTQSKLAVLSILFLVTGIFGLPLLWVNKKFSTAERVLWSLLLLAYTIALIGVTIAIFKWFYSFFFGG